MKILLCYSKDHFDPSLSPSRTASWGGSANILAREFFTTLSKFGDVTYSDGFDYKKHAGEKYDLFVGPDRNFHKILEVCEVKMSILIAVNMHPYERNRILKDFANNELGHREAITSGDIVDEEDSCKSISKADYIFCVGNNTTYNSYIKNGVPRNKIKTFNYHLLDNTPYIQKPHKKARFLYSASRIGLRKGFDIVESVAYFLQQYEFHLDIVGLPTNEYYLHKINRLTKELQDKVTYHGFIPANSIKYQKIYKSNDFFIFPSLEEGQAGTVLEAMHFSLVPLISSESGVDFSPLGFLETKLDSQINKDVLLEALSLEEKQVAKLKEKTHEYYKEFHQGFTKTLEESVSNCLNGNLYPKVSLVLPIYNKQDSIKELVQLMDFAAKEYGNTEAHIIFDGCKDNTEKVIKDFYRKKRDYNVKFYSTPNIFEVKTNNLGMLKSKGKYVIILQDDNYIYDKYLLFEAVQFLDKNPTVAILGCLAGVNFYPIGAKNKGSGQIISNEYESYWRQDENTDPNLKHRIFEVDACMRGPLIFRKSFLEKHGYLDEIFAPLYQDDMDICFRARKYNYKVYCMIMDVVNKSLTMASYDAKKAQYFATIMKRNANVFYSRWHPSAEKDYMWVNRIPLLGDPPRRINRLLAPIKNFITKFTLLKVLLDD